jgi:hypothetical protein
MRSSTILVKPGIIVSCVLVSYWDFDIYQVSLYHFCSFYQIKFIASSKPILAGQCNDRAGSFGKEISSE